MSVQVAQTDKDAFQRDGVVPLRQVLDADWLGRIAAAIEADIHQPGPFHGNLRLWETHATFREVCQNSPLPAIAQHFFDSEKVNLLYDQLFVKEVAMSQRTRWHNDQPYWPIRGWQVLSIWIALDPTTAANGRLEFIRGSHKWGRWFQPEVFGKTTAISQYEHNPDYEDIPDIEADRDSYDLISWDLEPGDVYVFHGMTVHGAGATACRIEDVAAIPCATPVMMWFTTRAPEPANRYCVTHSAMATRWTANATR